MSDPLGRVQKPDFYGYPGVEEESQEEIQEGLAKVQGEIEDVDLKIKQLNPLQIFERIRLNNKRNKLLSVQEGYKLDLEFKKSVTSSPDPRSDMQKTIDSYKKVQADFDAVNHKISEVDSKIKELKPQQMIEKFKLNRKRHRLLKERNLHQNELELLKPFYQAVVNSLQKSD